MPTTREETPAPWQGHTKVWWWWLWYPQNESVSVKTQSSTNLSFFPALFHEGGSDNLKTAFRLYRGPFLLVEFIFLIGINVYGWRSSGVNHVLIFELDPRNHLSEQHLMELAAIFGVVWALSILSFIYSASLSIPPFVNPLALVIIMLVFLMNPLKVFRHEARFWFLRICVSWDFFVSLACFLFDFFVFCLCIVPLNKCNFLWWHFVLICTEVRKLNSVSILEGL